MNLALAQKTADPLPHAFPFQGFSVQWGQSTSLWGSHYSPAHEFEPPLPRDQPHRRKGGLWARRCQIPDSAVFKPFQGPSDASEKLDWIVFWHTFINPSARTAEQANAIQ